MANTTLGYPYYTGTDQPAGFSQQQALAEAVDASPGIGSFTQTQINAFTAGQKRAGRVVWNSTTGKLQRCDGSTWVDVVLTDDARLSDSRTPTAHAASHAAAGSDPLTLSQSQVSGLAAALDAKVPFPLTGQNITGTTGTLALSDNGKIVTASNASPITIDIPANASVAFPVGAVVTVWQQAAGVVTLQGAGGVTVYGKSLSTSGAHSGIQAIKVDTNIWWVVPFVSGSANAVIGSTTGSPTITSYTQSGVTYDVYKFTGTGSITINADKAGYADVLVVGSGGGGGTAAAWNGGGGGGQVVEGSLWLPVGTHTVTVPGGGAVASKGSAASLLGLKAGGGGAGSSGGVGGGGSTGGGGCGTGSAAGGAGGMFNGGAGSAGAGFGGGGGAGAGAAGGAGVGSSGSGGTGGNGLQSSLLAGSAVYYGGGGGGQGSNGTNGAQFAGGQGGGGYGTGAFAGNAAAAGTANTGGGGGAGQGSSGAGGSAVVIIRVAR